MKVKKLIIPAAGWGTRFLPLTKVVHKELVPVLNKPAIDYLVEEAIESGIEQIWLIISPRKEQLLDYFRTYYDLEAELESKNKEQLLELVRKTNFEKNSKVKISIIYQNEQLGLGHAIATAQIKIKNEPFAVILGDDLMYSPEKHAIKQLIEEFEKRQSSIIGVTSVAWENVDKYGIVVPKNSEEKENDIFEIASAVEKPKVSESPSNKAIIGRYVFTPEILPILKNTQAGVGGEVQLVDAFPELMKTQKIYAQELKGIRYDLGSIEGFVKANIDYALENKELRESIIEFMKERVK